MHFTKMNNLVIVAFIAFASVLSITIRVTQAGPVIQVPRSSYNVRSKREIYPEILDEPEKVEDSQPQVCVVGDLVYEVDEAVPADQPCLKCKCQPPGVHCEATRCEKKPGCRAIHKPNTCCPEYQCECDYEGKTYANGERLEQKPGTECKVCYCRGGEVQCAEVSCYIRNDCEGRKVPGKCCPKYDHCPPKEPSSVFYPNEVNETAKSQQREQHLQQEEQQQNEEDTQKITIQEIIPEIKEIPITNSPKREINEVAHGHLLVEEDTEENATSNNANSNELDIIPDSEVESSEVAEVYQQPPPVLRIGDKLLFLKKDGELVSEKDASTPSTVITIIGAEGLQRGFEESLENHESGNNKNEKYDRGEHDELAATVDSHDNDEDDIQTVAESTYILSLVNRPTTETQTGNVANTEEPNANATDLLVSLDDTGNFTDLDISFDGVNATELIESSSWMTTEAYSSNAEFETSEVVSSTSTTTTTNVGIIGEKDEMIESNPEYPPIPDVMTQQVEDTDLQSPDGQQQQQHQAQPKILPEVYEVRANDSSSNTANASGSGSINSSWLKKTLLNPAATLPDSILSSVAESDSTSTAASSSDAETETTSITPTPTPVSLSAETTLASLPSNTNNNRSMETMESLEVTEDSDEAVTQANDHASILNDESNASVEDMGASSTAMSSSSSLSSSGEVNTAELVEMVPGYENITIESVEAPTSATPETRRPEDVEMIDVDLLRGHSDDEAKNATHEGMQTTAGDKKVGKRESSEDDKVFEELDREIGLDTGAIVTDASREDQEKEAKAIFSELVNEATSNTTPKPVNLQGSAPQTPEQHAQAQALQRIGDALSKFQLRDSKKASSVDGNVLGILRDFFTAQYRAYN